MTGSRSSSISDKPASGAYCRDCAGKLAPDQRRCTACRSPRTLTHAEIDELTIAHIDCDAFYAAVEKRDDPTLADKPVIIGGGRRGVVSTACYNARIYGVHSAMPMFKALKACPDAVVIPPDMDKYARVGAEIKDRMRALTPLVESLSIDEAFLDLAGTEKLHGGSAARSLIRLVRDIRRDIGIDVSVGLSHNKFLAKLASDMDKPRGFSVIGRAETLELLAGLPVSKIWGVGKATQKSLAANGITMVGQLQHMEETELVRQYGSMGLRLARLSQGRDARSIEPVSAAKSISSETTFEKDLGDADALEKILWQLCERTAARCKKKGHAGRTLVLKLKSAQFTTLTRNKQLPQPTQMADIMFEFARPMLRDVLAADPRQRFRLIGIGVSGLIDAALADQPDLADPDKMRRLDAERAIDSLRAKFGKSSIGKGRGF